MKDTGKTIHGVKVYSDPEVPPNTLYMLNNDFNDELPPRRSGILTNVDEPDIDPENVGFKEIMYKGKPMVRDTEASITLLYPNDTSVTIRGDGDIVKQLVDRLDGQVIDYTVKVPSHDSI